MNLDSATLAVVACMTTAVVGALLLFSWWLDRRSTALGWWSLCGLTAATASLCYMLDGATSASLGRQVANGLFLLAYGISFGAARRFGGKSMPWLVIVAGPLLWFGVNAAVSLEFFGRLVLMSALVAGYGLMTARELWSESGAGMPSQRAAAVVTAINAFYFLMRPLGGPGMTALTDGVPLEPTAGWLSVVGIVIILYAMIFGFLIMAMAKEKADLEHRRAALVDSLTGVCNRGAFMTEAARLLAGAQRARRPAALVMFDLDHFKLVNDTHGHLVGDQALVEFCAAASGRLPDRAVLGRLGGEEFAILVDGFDQAGAVEMAEAIRLDLVEAAAVIMGRPVAATVSAGVAATAGAQATLADLMGGADNALYRAKAQGRNRVVAEIHRMEPSAHRPANAMAVA